MDWQSSYFNIGIYKKDIKLTYVERMVWYRVQEARGWNEHSDKGRNGRISLFSIKNPKMDFNVYCVMKSNAIHKSNMHSDDINSEPSITRINIKGIQIHEKVLCACDVSSKKYKNKQ